MQLADTSVSISGPELLALSIAVIVLLAVQIWALIEVIHRRRWGWLIAIWAGFPIGTLAWLFYGRQRNR